MTRGSLPLCDQFTAPLLPVFVGGKEHIHCRCTKHTGSWGGRDRGAKPLEGSNECSRVMPWQAGELKMHGTVRPEPVLAPERRFAARREEVAIRLAAVTPRLRASVGSRPWRSRDAAYERR